MTNSKLPPSAKKLAIVLALVALGFYVGVYIRVYYFGA